MPFSKVSFGIFSHFGLCNFFLRYPVIDAGSTDSLEQSYTLWFLEELDFIKCP